MGSTLRAAWCAGCALALLTAAGCASGQPTRLYVLAPHVATTDRASTGLAVGLRPVKLPAELDRPEIVTRTGEHTVALAELDRWASPLAEQFTEVLALDLAALIPAERVAVFPWGPRTPLDYEIAVDVVRADGALGGACTLVAYWAIARRGAPGPMARGRFMATEPAGANYATLVAAMSRLVSALGGEIATALRAAAR